MRIDLNLPPETWDHVLDHLWDDHRALAACGLTCRAWVPTTRLHLFRVVRLRDPLGYALFDDLISTSTYIASCVRSLTITKADLRLTWLDHELPRILRRLNRVECLTTDHWNALDGISAGVLQALPTLCAPLTTLSLRNTVFPQNSLLPQVICACSNLTTLRFSGTEWLYVHRPPQPFSDDIASVVPAKDVEIKELTLDQCSSSITAWLLCGPLILNIKKLIFSWRGWLETARDMQDMLSTVGPRLDHLEISIPLKQGASATSRWRNLSLLDLSQTTCLRSLRLHGINVDGRLPHLRHEYDPVVSALATLSSERLERVQIDVQLLRPGDLARLDWAKIDAHLARLALDRPQLVVVIRVAGSTPPFASTQEVVHGVVSCLPVLCAGGTMLGVVCNGTRLPEVTGSRLHGAHLAKNVQHWFPRHVNHT
ncbi:hypothetical protein B0H21DRAFT_421148 [Amylocystis lapponica]|nr:hypothetical protein B0H21DRAFT_421148 [Amylocystis lapponica]